MLGRQWKSELHGKAEDPVGAQHGEADDRHGPGQGPARRHQHEGDGLGRGARRGRAEVG